MNQNTVVGSKTLRIINSQNGIWPAYYIYLY